MSSRLMKSDSAGAVPRYGFRMMTLHPEGSRRRSFISTWLLDVIALGVLVDSDFCKCFILSFSFGSCTSLRWWRLVVRRPPREDRGSPFYLKCICPAQMREGGQDIFFFEQNLFFLVSFPVIALSSGARAQQPILRVSQTHRSLLLASFTYNVLLPCASSSVIVRPNGERTERKKSCYSLRWFPFARVIGAN